MNISEHLGADKARNLVELFFNRPKQFRCIATRYDKLANRFNAFLHLACAYFRSAALRGPWMARRRKNHDSND